MAKLTMHYVYRSSNGVFSGQGTYTSDAIISVPTAIDEIRRKLNLDTPYATFTITPIAFTVEDYPVAWWKCCLVAFLMALAGGAFAGAINTQIMVWQR